MSKEFKLILMSVFLFFALVFQSMADAAYSKPGPLDRLEFVTLSNQALNAAVDTEFYNIGGFAYLMLEIQVTDADNSITRLDFSCQSSSDDAPNTTLTNANQINVMTPASTGITTYEKFSGQLPLSASVKKHTINLRVRYRWIRCTFEVGAGSGAVADKLQVISAATVQ